MVADAGRRRFAFWSEGYESLGTLHRRVAYSGLDPRLLELVRMRASQVNGCAFCIDMHSKDARQAGETEQRLYALSAWREAPFFDERKRAALTLTEAVTLVTDHEGVERASEEAAAHFEPQELSVLLYAIIEINAWNRLAITTGLPEPGSYDPGETPPEGP
jgi:AhpD family alkylhydroperoxidase